MTDPSQPSEDTDHFYRRRLPHWQPAGATIFLTWRLYGCLPQQALDRLASEQDLLENQPVRPGETPRDRALRHSKRLFALADDLLASNTRHPQWLRQKEIARLVVDALFYHDGNLYVLLAFVIMSNHVHVLFRPLKAGKQAETSAPQEAAGTSDIKQDEVSPTRYVPLRRITQSLKGYTAWEANRLIKRTGSPFWQDESYDHWVRDEAELGRIVTYIESDPVRAGLVASPEDWRWSSAWERKWGRLKDRPWLPP